MECLTSAAGNVDADSCAVSAGESRASQVDVAQSVDQSFAG